MDVWIGQIMAAAFDFAPQNWALCNGQLLQISQNQALFALLGTTFGGDGIRTFGLPNLQGRVPVGAGQLARGSNYSLGATGGVSAVSLQISQVPQHSHTISASTDNTNQNSPVNDALGQATAYINAKPDTTMSGAAVSASGGSQPHSNTQPYVVINFCISLTGIFPPRN